MNNLQIFIEEIDTNVVAFSRNIQIQSESSRNFFKVVVENFSERIFLPKTTS